MYSVYFTFHDSLVYHFDKDFVMLLINKIVSRLASCRFEERESEHRAIFGWPFVPELLRVIPHPAYIYRGMACHDEHGVSRVRNGRGGGI